MLRVFQSLVLVLACYTPDVVVAQQQPLDESLIERPDQGIDFPGCYRDLDRADLNRDGFVKQNEYLRFIQEYGKRICFSTDALTLQQYSTFNTLACICRSQEGSDADCCVGAKAQIPTAGALQTIAAQTPNQRNYLTSVCKLTDATIDGQCAPVVTERGTPLDGLASLDSLIGPPAEPNRWWIWLLLALLALLLLCCLLCCCVWKRRKHKEEEEEEEEVVDETGLGNKGMPVPMGPEQPAGVGPALYEHPPDDPMGASREGGGMDNLGPGMGASGAAVAEDSDEEEEGRKRRGGGILPPEDEESGLKIPTAPRLPPPEAPEDPGLKLRPIPDKEHEDDEWDHAGRNIDFPKDKDEMSAGEVEHYEPDGGVYLPEREGKDPLNWKKDWNRQKPEEPDEIDPRKHRIQSGLGQGEVWNKLGEDETTDRSKQAPTGDVFDWVVQSALGALDKNDEAES